MMQHMMYIGFGKGYGNGFGVGKSGEYTGGDSHQWKASRTNRKGKAKGERGGHAPHSSQPAVGAGTSPCTK